MQNIEWEREEIDSGSVIKHFMMIYDETCNYFWLWKGEKVLKYNLVTILTVKGLKMLRYRSWFDVTDLNLLYSLRIAGAPIRSEMGLNTWNSITVWEYSKLRKFLKC